MLSKRLRFCDRERVCELAVGGVATGPIMQGPRPRRRQAGGVPPERLQMRQFGPKFAGKKSSKTLRFLFDNLSKYP